jgi:hypothetical protein
LPRVLAPVGLQESRELDFMPWGDAYNRVPADATAFVHRDARFQLKHAAVVDPQASTVQPKPRIGGDPLLVVGAPVGIGPRVPQLR